MFTVSVCDMPARRPHTAAPPSPPQRGACSGLAFHSIFVLNSVCPQRNVHARHPHPTGGTLASPLLRHVQFVWEGSGRRIQLDSIHEAHADAVHDILLREAAIGLGWADRLCFPCSPLHHCAIHAFRCQHIRPASCIHPSAECTLMPLRPSAHRNLRPPRPACSQGSH